MPNMGLYEWEIWALFDMGTVRIERHMDDALFEGGETYTNGRLPFNVMVVNVVLHPSRVHYYVYTLRAVRSEVVQ